jgi:tetratricopeptide (TPR) repeat protein
MHCVIRPLLYFALAIVGLPALTHTAGAQIPEKFENLQYFPKEIPRDSLVNIMRGFSFSLGVRCQFCHAGGDGVSFQGVNFASDEKVTKKNARYMLRMVDSLNRFAFAGLPERQKTPVKLECTTCHRGNFVPATLASALGATIAEKGVDSAVARYRVMRQNMELGKYDLGEWSMNEFARTLREQGKVAEAIAMLELNSEFYPNSPAISMGLGDMYRERGDKAKALEWYKKVLERQPNNPIAKQRVDELSKP